MSARPLSLLKPISSLLSFPFRRSMLRMRAAVVGADHTTGRSVRDPDGGVGNICMNIEQLSRPGLYLSIPHPCSYLPDRTASTLFVDPDYPVPAPLYTDLNRRGFRRSGNLIYRPHCADCAACIAVRIPVADFIPSRGQKRTWKKNQDLTVRIRPAEFDEEHFKLFLRYQSVRHTGGGMDSPDRERYVRFLVGGSVETRFCEIRLQEQLLGVAVIDLLSDGISAMYTFYDPDRADRGLGVFSVLWQVEYARSLGLPWVYLGYWIKQSPKMAYKVNYRPLEAYSDGTWSRLEADCFRP